MWWSATMYTKNRVSTLKKITNLNLKSLIRTLNIVNLYIIIYGFHIHNISPSLRTLWDWMLHNWYRVFFFFLNTMFYLNIKKMSDWAESFLTPYFSNMFKKNKKLKKTKLNQEVKWQKEKEKRRGIKIKHSV
jgi:hypothetical protein